MGGVGTGGVGGRKEGKKGAGGGREEEGCGKARAWEGRRYRGPVGPFLGEGGGAHTGVRRCFCIVTF